MSLALEVTLLICTLFGPLIITHETSGNSKQSVCISYH